MSADLSIDLSGGPMIPSEVILPLFAADSGGNPGTFLGTGFFVGPECIFVTTHHNTAGARGPLIVVEMAEKFPAHLAQVAFSDPATDVALLSVADLRPKKWLALASSDILYLDKQVTCFEYGTTVTRGTETILSPAARVGNITRSFAKLEILGKTYRNALELSFPALRGASGAPVLSTTGFLVLGMIVGNMQYELLPAQIERVVNPDGTLAEEVRYMLPLAIALSASSIAAALEASRRRNDATA